MLGEEEGKKKCLIKEVQGDNFTFNLTGNKLV